MRPVAAVVVASVLVVACGRATLPSPVELAERHIECFNDGDVDGFLAAFADETVVMGGTPSDPDVVEQVAFQLGSVHGADGYVATCEPWGDDGARCEGYVYDRVTSPAGLTRHLTLMYKFNSEGEIAHLGEMNVYDPATFNRYSSELAAWVTSNYPELAPVVVEHGHIRKTGADAIELLIRLAEEFTQHSDAWPIEP